MFPHAQGDSKEVYFALQPFGMGCKVHCPEDLAVIKGTNVDRVKIGGSEEYPVRHEKTYSTVVGVPVAVLEKMRIDVLKKPRDMQGIGMYLETPGEYRRVPFTKDIEDGSYLVPGTELVILKEKDKVSIDV